MTSCDPADINFNLCQVLVDRLADQQDRLDLIWWGAWAVAGLLLALLIAPLWLRTWRSWREDG